MMCDLVASSSSFQSKVILRNKSAKDLTTTTKTVRRHQLISALKWNRVAQPTF